MGNKVCRFIATGRSYGAGKIRITREGYETDDAREIEFLRKSPDFGVFFYEVATSRDLEEERLKDALALLTAGGSGRAADDPRGTGSGGGSRKSSSPGRSCGTESRV